MSCTSYQITTFMSCSLYHIMHELFLHHIIIIVHERSEHISASHSLQETSKARDHLEENIPPKGMWLWIHTGDMEPMNTYICRNKTSKHNICLHYSKITSFEFRNMKSKVILKKGFQY